MASTPEGTNPERAPRVLIVEDERIIAKDLQRMLRGCGYEADAIASSAAEALALAAEQTPDIVLMDIHIRGDIDGVGAARLLGQRFRLPVVYVTAYADDATVERAKATNPFGYLLKPVNAAELKTAIEVTLQKHGLERRLRERERWLATTLGALTDAVVSCTVEHRIAFANRAAEALLGSSDAPLLGAPVERVLSVFAASHRELLRGLLAESPEQPAAVELADAELVSPTLGKRIVNGHAARAIDDGAALGLVVVLRDVTEQHRARGQLELSERMVALSTLAAGLAHEINNPLAVVIGNTGILLEELAELKAGFASPAPPDPAFSLAKLAVCIDCGTATQRAGRRIGHVVSEVHAFARAMPSGSARTNLSAAVDRAVNATAALFADRASVTISLGSDPIASGAPSQIERVLVNLLANAADAIAPGRPLENRVIVSTAVDEHSHAVIEVSDTGRGIPKDQLGRVFDPFFTTKPPGLGLGLGLSVCRGIVAALGGSIDVTSQVGQGTTFRVVLETVAGDSANTEA